MTRSMRSISKVLILGSLGFFSDLVAEDVEANGFIVSELAGGHHPRTRSEVAHREFRSGDYQSSAKSFENVLANDPNNGQAWYNLGVVQLNLKQYDEAIRSLHSSMKTGMGEKARYHLAYALANSGEIIGAIGHLKTVLKSEPEHELAWTLLGRCYESYGRLGQAKKCYEKALSIDPELGQAIYFLEKLPQQTQTKIPNLKLADGGNIAPSDETQVDSADYYLPLSRVLRDDGKTSSAHRGPLPPLHHTYHLSSDLPGGVTLKPTVESNMQELKAEETKEMAGPEPLVAPEPPKIEIPLGDL